MIEATEIVDQKKLSLPNEPGIPNSDNGLSSNIPTNEKSVPQATEEERGISPPQDDTDINDSHTDKSDNIEPENNRMDDPSMSDQPDDENKPGIPSVCSPSRQCVESGLEDEDRTRANREIRYPHCNSDDDSPDTNGEPMDEQGLSQPAHATATVEGESTQNNNNLPTVNNGLTHSPPAMVSSAGDIANQEDFGGDQHTDHYKQTLRRRSYNSTKTTAA